MFLPAPPENLLGWAQIIAGLGTVILTLFLVYLYKGQKEQLAANHKAELEISDYDWNGDEVTIYLSNYGNGVAKNLSLLTLVYADTGEHREYKALRAPIHRHDKQGEKCSIIEPGEEEIEFSGESIVGKPLPPLGRYVPIKFSNFVREIKKTGDTTEINYQHVIQGTELSRRKHYAPINITTIINPQDFEQEHSLSNPPGFKITGDGYGPLLLHLYPPIPRKLGQYIYTKTMFALNWIIPKIRVKPRPLDVSGKKRIRRVFLRYKIKKKIKRLKDFFVG